MAQLKVKSDVAGTVWEVVSKPGEALAAGATIMILESMKMEIPVEAPAKGTLKSLLVQKGDVVSEGQDLAIIDT
jgi:acetyl-CoA carboxylase biotin carboxyl carrier protein